MRAGLRELPACSGTLALALRSVGDRLLRCPSPCRAFTLSLFARWRARLPLVWRASAALARAPARGQGCAYDVAHCLRVRRQSAFSFLVCMSEECFFMQVVVFFFQVWIGW